MNIHVYSRRPLRGVNGVNGRNREKLKGSHCND